MKGFIAIAGPSQSVSTASRLKAMSHPLREAVEIVSVAEGLASAHTTTAPLTWYRGRWGACAVAGQPSLTVLGKSDPVGVAAYLESALPTAGAEAFNKVHGNFAAIAVAHGGEEIWLAVDRLGIDRLCYAQVGRQWLMANRADCLRYADPEATLNSQAIYDFVFSHGLTAPRTMFNGHHQVPNGHAVHIKNGQARAHAYWNLKFTEDHADFGPLKQEFMSVLEAAHRPYQHRQDTATFLSGGTDSSTVCGMLSKVQGKGARCYSIGFEADGYDETEFARSAAQHFGADHRVYYVTPQDVISGIDTVARFYDQPFGNASAVPVYWCAKKAHDDGIRLLLAGDGGDELFGGNTRYATQWQFSLYENIPSWIRRSLMQPLLGHLPSGIPLVSKAGSYVRQAQVPMPDRLHTYNLVHQIGAEQLFSPEFLAQVDQQAPLRAQRQVYEAALAKSLINKMLWLDFKYTLADSDLPKVTGMCEAAGVEVAYPLLDESIIEFSAKLAPHMKLRGTQLRYFFKKALNDFLPQSTLTKSKHGFGLPFGMWLSTHKPLQELAYASLESLDGRGIFKKNFAKELVERHRSGNAAYYGTLIWVLMMLEHWFVYHHTPELGVSREGPAK